MHRHDTHNHGMQHHGIKELAKIKPLKDMALTVGVFDGVHLGHRYLIGKVLDRAKSQERLSGVITFYPHPREVLTPELHPGYLASLPERIRLLYDLGVDIVVTLRFNRELAALPAADFIGHLHNDLRMRELVVGSDFALGKGREGTAERLKAIGDEMGFSVTIVDQMSTDEHIISSTAIRRALAEGDTPTAAKLLGRPVFLSGLVVQGARRGRTIGFPTANVAVDKGCVVPANGVYATRASFRGQTFPSVTNIGTRPTFDNGMRTVEVHILDFSGDIYGEIVKLEMVKRLRAETRFSSVDDLKTQISKDVEIARALL